MNARQYTIPQPSLSKVLSPQAKSWFSRLKVGRKITLGYVVALGIAVAGSINGIAIGNRYERQAYDIQQDAIEEILELKDLEKTLISLRMNEKALIIWLDDSQAFQATSQAYQENALEFQEEWSELLADYAEDAGVGAEREEELGFLETLKNEYDGVLELHIQDLNRFLRNLDVTDLSGTELNDVRRQLVELSRRPSARQLKEFADQLSEFVESIENIELQEAEKVVEAAAQIRLQIMGVSIVLSLMVAGLFALLIGRTITVPLKALKETALRVTQDENFDLRVVVMSDDEVGSLGLSVNQLIEWVGAYTHSLREAQKGLEHKTQELNAIIDNLGDGLLVANAEGSIILSNPSLRKMLDLNDTPLSGLSVETILEPHITQLIAKNQTEPQISLSAELTLAADRIGKALVTAIIPDLAADFDKEAVQSTGSVVLIRDITAEKEVDQMKTDFISTVSHELRTPLTSVLGFAKLIQKKLEGTILPAVKTDSKRVDRAVRQVRENLNIIVAEGERLTSLINDVLDIAKIEAGKIEWNMQPFTISEIIDRAIVATSVLATNSGLVIIRDVQSELPMVVGDRDRLIQVIINLLSNAIKFTEDGSVTCHAHCQDDEVIISIIDTGIGLATGDLEKVFEKFTQVGEVMTNKPKGTGLGLPICKQIIEHHGGRIWADSQLGQGSTFTFTLPAGSSAATGVTNNDWQELCQQLKDNVDRAIPLGSERNKTILVVDDEPHIRKLLRQELETAGYQIKEAQDGIDALRQIKAGPPDLVILDVMMPDINGFDLAAVLKSNPTTMVIPTIVLSIIQDQERGYRLGVDRYLSKPINTELLLRDINTLLEQGASSHRVLVVDKDTSATKTLAEVLLSKGYVVTEAATGYEAIEKALSLEPDMIIVDASTSTKHNLVKTLRFDNGLENVFIIMVDQPQALSLTQSKNLRQLPANTEETPH